MSDANIPLLLDIILQTLWTKRTFKPSKDRSPRHKSFFRWPQYDILNELLSKGTDAVLPFLIDRVVHKLTSQRLEIHFVLSVMSELQGDSFVSFFESGGDGDCIDACLVANGGG